MNAIALFLTLVLYGNPTCQPDAVNETVVNGHPYAIQTFQCFWRGADSDRRPSHTFEVWSPVCHQYVEQPVLISERHARQGWAMNKFGEFYPATHDVDLSQIHQSDCGVHDEGVSAGSADTQLDSVLMRLKKTLSEPVRPDHRGRQR
jgi:hypothetical protein